MSSTCPTTLNFGHKKPSVRNLYARDEWHILTSIEQKSQE